MGAWAVRVTTTRTVPRALLFRLPTSVLFWFIKKLLWVLLRSIASPGQGLCVILLSGFMGTFCNTRR
jgi:hypothetical protein